MHFLTILAIVLIVQGSCFSSDFFKAARNDGLATKHQRVVASSDWKNIQSRKCESCAKRIMIAVDASETNVHFETVKNFLVNNAFAEGNFKQTNRLGISRYFAGKDWYKMIALWGGYTQLEHVRNDISSWKQEPETHSALSNAIGDLSRSWPEKTKHTKTNYIVFTSSIDQKAVDEAKQYADTLKINGRLFIVALGDLDSNLISQLTPNFFVWKNPSGDPVPAFWKKWFWAKF